MKTAINGLILATGVLGASLAHSAEESFNVAAFDQLNLKKGIEATVYCGNEPKVVATAQSHVLDVLELTSQNGELSVSNEAYSEREWWNKDNRLSLAIYTNQPISNFENYVGVKLDVASCAVNSSQVSVTGTVGTDISLAGQTERLNLALLQGGNFTARDGNFVVDSVDLSLEFGSHAELCHASQVSGYMSFGTSLHLGATTQYNVSQSFASSIRTDLCQ
jgi:hypothetical protein